MSRTFVSNLIAATAICIQAPDAFGQTNPAPSASPETSEKSLPFETIEFEWGQFGQHRNKAQYVIRNQTEWDAMWRNAHPRPSKNQAIPLPLSPPVDFDQEMIIAVFMGSCNTGGYSIRVDQALENSERLKIVVRQRTPPPGSWTTQSFTFPSHLVRVPKSAKPVCFRIMTIKHPTRSGHLLKDGPIDPDIYKEFKYNPEGKAFVHISIKAPKSREGMPSEARNRHIKGVQNSLLQRMGPKNFEIFYKYNIGGLAGKITREGLKRLEKDPNLRAVSFEGPFSLPDEFVIEQDCE